MARPKGTSGKWEKEKQRKKQKQDKREKMEERKASQSKGKSLDDMMAYVDENGNITSVPPDPSRKKPINAEDIQIGVPKSEDAASDLRSGKVDYFDASKGFGFIIEDNGTKTFFHVNDVTYPIREGDSVSYTVNRGPKGWNAAGVTKKT